MTTNLLFLGPLDNHQRCVLPFLSKRGYNVSVINTSHWWFPKSVLGPEIPIINLYENNKLQILINNKMGWFIKAPLYSLTEKTKQYNQKINRAIKEKEIDLILGSWGSHSLPEIRLVQEPTVPMIYEFLTYPTNLISFAVKVEDMLSKTVVNRLDGRILPSQRMLIYMKKAFGVEEGENLIFEECYSQQYFFRQRLPKLSEKSDGPHIIFIGSDPIEVFPQIAQISQKEIHVHICEKKGLDVKLQNFKHKRFVHTFKKFSYDQL